jgi:hypothetical protein
LNKKLIALVCTFPVCVLAQLGGGYSGPSVLSRGAGEIGNRSGQEVDLRFYGGVTGTYDSGIQPVATDSKGNLLTVGGLYGVEATFGAYGSHSWRKAKLGLDYHGSFRHYDGASSLDGVDQTLQLGYTYQKSRHFVINAQALAGIITSGLNAAAYGYPNVTNNTVAQPTSQLFDNRSNYLQGGMDFTFVQSPRTSYTFGGDGFVIRRHSSQLIGVNGYVLRGSVEHRLSARTEVGFFYSRDHYDFPKSYGKADISNFGQSDIDVAHLIFGTMFGPRWRLTAQAGVFHSEVQGVETVFLSPAVAALFGQSTTFQVFYRESVYPSGNVALTRQFHTSALSFNYGRTITPGNGVYLTSRSEGATANYSYTGIRRVNFSITGGYNTLKSVGAGIQPYRQATGGTGLTYSLGKGFQASARYDYRYQAVEELTYKHTGYRMAIGLSYSPGNVPLSLW